MSYEFQSTLFDNKSTYIECICQEFLTAGGENNANDIMDAYQDFTDSELADELIEGFGEFNDVTRDELIEQLSEMRASGYTNTEIAGNPVNFKAAVELMDNDIRESLHNGMAPCTDQQFLDAYIDAHEERFNESFTV